METLFLRRIDLPIRRPCVFPRVWQIFNYRSKFSIGSQTSMFNVNVEYCRSAQIAAREIPVLIWVRILTGIFFLLFAHVNPF